MKKTLSIVLALIMALGVFGGAGAYAFAEEEAPQVTQEAEEQQITGEQPVSAEQPEAESAAEEKLACGKKAYYTFDKKTKTLTVSGSGNMYNYNYSKVVSPFANNKKNKKNRC